MNIRGALGTSFDSGIVLVIADSTVFQCWLIAGVPLLNLLSILSVIKRKSGAGGFIIIYKII